MSLEEAVQFVRTKEREARSEGFRDVANCYGKMREFLENASSIEEATGDMRAYAKQKNTLKNVGVLFTTHANFFQYGKLD